MYVEKGWKHKLSVIHSLQVVPCRTCIKQSRLREVILQDEYYWFRLDLCSTGFTTQDMVANLLWQVKAAHEAFQFYLLYDPSLGTEGGEILPQHIW